MNFSKYIRCTLLTLFLLVFPCLVISAPLSGPAATNDLNAYGEVIYPDNDITNDESTPSENADLFEKARMAFLFGQYKLAFAGWEPLANDGYAQAQATLAWMYHTGKGVKQNHRTAYYWYGRAANQSHAIATNNLGVFYEQGLGVRENMRLAAQNYLDSAQSGYAYAQYNIGMLYHDGRGVKKSQKEAIFWLQIAALQGVTQAQDILESMGRKVDVPQHAKLKKHLAAKTDRPKWHKKKLEATVSSHRKQKTEDLYKKQRESARERAKTFKRKSKQSKPSITKTTHAKPPSKTPSRMQQLLDRNRALVANKPGANKTQPIRIATAKKPLVRAVKPSTLLAGTWVKKQNPKRYTLQIASSNKLNELESLASLLNKDSRVAYYRTKERGKKKYSLIFGVYSSRSAARRNIKTLPREFKQWSPWIRRFSEVQARMKSK